MRYLPLDSKLFTGNRNRFIKKMKKNSLAIFQAHPAIPENGDAQGYHKPNSDVVWLSGIVQEKTMVVLYPDNIDKACREVLVILRPNENLEKWEGKKLTKQNARDISGMKTVIFLDQFDAMLQSWMHHCEHVYLDTNENDRLSGEVVRLDLLFVQKIQAQYPLHNYERAALITKELRAIKSKYEIDVMQKAVDITHKAFLRVCKFLKPGVWEYEVEAEITHEFMRNRATRHAYGCILASGDRARYLHYVDNNQECKAGELILMDFGAEYGNYCSDLSRTIPVSGKFTKRQKEVYDACLAVHRYANKVMRPGKTWLEVTALAEKEMEKQLIKIGLLTKAEVKNQDPASPAFKKYFYHGLGHHIGLDVHDIGTRNEKIKEGMVFTIEPGIYIEEEQMGIRIENDYVIGKKTNRDLFKGIPITTSEIEKAMSRK